MSTRESYEAKAQVEFAVVQLQLAALAARAQGAVAAGQADGERLLTAAQSKHDQALHRFELLKRAGEDDWEAIQSSFEASWTELRAALALQG